MGEKLLAQRLIRLLRETESRSSRTARTLIQWIADEAAWLWPDMAFETDEDGGQFWDSLPALAEAIDTEEGEPSPAMAAASAVADLLAFAPFDREVLCIVTALSRLSHIGALRSRFYGCGDDLLRLVGRLAGAEAGAATRRVRRSEPVTLGLVYAGGGDGRDIGAEWGFNRVLDAGLTEPAELIEALAGAPQRPSLAEADFAEQAEPIRLLVRLLGGALRGRAPGVNVLLYGPPGTGKTELARVLAAACEAPLYAVGEENDYGEEPDRGVRLASLRRSSGCSSGAGAPCCCSTRWRISSSRRAGSRRRPRCSSTGCSRATRCRPSGPATASTWSIPRTCAG